MRIGWVGLGKLGLPCALAMERTWSEVRGWDPSAEVVQQIEKRHVPYQEEGVDALLAHSAIQVVPTEELCAWADVLFVAVQTPHNPNLDGTKPMGPLARSDFDYIHLVRACREVAAGLSKAQRSIPVVIVSTVLPGTIRREILDTGILPSHLVVYNPFFIAMGTAVRDFTNPEFVLLGATDRHSEALRTVITLYQRLLPNSHAPIHTVTVESAELAKVGYNTFIGAKIAFSSHLAEVADATGANCDEVVDVLSTATRRLLSPAYLRPGMGDGGGCHPRDNLALSWLAESISESYDFAGAMMTAREQQCRHLADLVAKMHHEHGLPVVLLGRAYKANSPLTLGSAGILLEAFLRRRGTHAESWDPLVDGPDHPIWPASIFVLTVPHDELMQFLEAGVPNESHLVDPWGVAAPRVHVTLHQPGRMHPRLGPVPPAPPPEPEPAEEPPSALAPPPHSNGAGMPMVATLVGQGRLWQPEPSPEAAATTGNSNAHNQWAPVTEDTELP